MSLAQRKLNNSVRSIAVSLALVCGYAMPVQAALGEEATNITSLKALQSAVTKSGRAIASFRVEGQVCAASSQDDILVLRDDSGAVLLELPDLTSDVKAGDGIVIEGHNTTLTRGPFGIQIGTAPVIEIDGEHGIVQKSGKVYLNAGFQPLRVEWFIGTGDPALELEYQGPGVSRTLIPAHVLWRRRASEGGSGNLEQGLNFANFEIDRWSALPDFRKIKPIEEGKVAGLDVSRRAHPQRTAMLFTGYLEVANAGLYTFLVRSKDGTRLYVGDPRAYCTVSLATNGTRSVTAKNFSEILGEGGDQEWTTLEGKVESVREQKGLAELEISFGQRPVSVTILNVTSSLASRLREASVQVTGVYQRTWGTGESFGARLIVPGVEQLVIKDALRPLDERDTLTLISQIRALSPEEARKHLPVKIRGIVTTANYWSCILQDASGGVYIDYLPDDWVNQPHPGEVWEFTGLTDAGAFSPIVLPTHGRCVGNAALPRGIRPTWSDLMNGSRDAEQVEIEAAVIAQNNAEMTLLTHDGKVLLLGDEYHPLPTWATAEAETSLVGSIVALQGVYAAEWNSTTHLVKPGAFWLGNAMLSLIEPTPTNYFEGPVSNVSDLLKFKSQSKALRRVRVAGVVLNSQPGEYILNDNTGSIRVITRGPAAIEEGDWVEAVGFPQLGGPSPRLLEAMVRKRGSAPRPQPVRPSIQELPEAKHDGMLVEIDALLLSDSVQQGERMLGLRAGPHQFLAKLRPASLTIPALRIGSSLRLTGVYSSARVQQADNTLDAFDLLVTRPTDVVVLQSGPWWTPRRAITLIIILIGGLVVALAWAALLRRTVARRSGQLKKEIESRQRVEQHRLLEQERVRVSQDLHDELGAGLAELGMLGSLANNPSVKEEKQHAYLNRLSELSRLLVTGLDEIVWAISPRHDSNKSVSAYFCEYAQEFLQPTGIACRLDVANALPSQVLNAQQRHQLFLAFKEALTNVVKHAQATDVCIKIGGRDDELWIEVADNGKGFRESASHPGRSGLTNMIERLEHIGGKCEIRDRPDGGTVVRFRLFTTQELHVS